MEEASGGLTSDAFGGAVLADPSEGDRGRQGSGLVHEVERAVEEGRSDPS